MLANVFVNEILESAFVAIAHGLELPFAVTLVEAAELHGSFYGEVLVEVVFGDFFVGDGIVDADI